MENWAGMGAGGGGGGVCCHWGQVGVGATVSRAALCLARQPLQGGRSILGRRLPHATRHFLQQKRRVARCTARWERAAGTTLQGCNTVGVSLCEGQWGHVHTAVRQPIAWPVVPPAIVHMQ